MELIPAIDLRGGRCVRLLKGRFDAETLYARDPFQLADEYRALGAARVHVVDLDGARDGAPVNREAIARIASLRGIAVQAGGGVRSEESLEALFGLGVARVVLGSLAIREAEIFRRWLDRYGPERLALALDVRHDAAGRPMLVSHGWQRTEPRDLWEILEDRVAGYGGGALRHVLCTDVDRDGALAGPNLGLYKAAARRYPGIAWQASGGVRDAGDLGALRRAGAAAAVCGRALLEGRITPAEMRPFLPNA
jgi:phosphoribosylformimino-5-aminoimidazole carboxamide ribotide isomerase